MNFIEHAPPCFPKGHRYQFVHDEEILVIKLSEITTRFPKCYNTQNEHAGFVSESGIMYLISFSICGEIDCIYQIWYELDINKPEYMPNINPVPNIDLDKEMLSFIGWIANECSPLGVE
jgi:hypothetical protein